MTYLEFISTSSFIMLFAIAWFTASMADALKTLKVDIQIYQVPVEGDDETI